MRIDFRKYGSKSGETIDWSAELVAIPQAGDIIMTLEDDYVVQYSYWMLNEELQTPLVIVE